MKTLLTKLFKFILILLYPVVVVVLLAVAIVLFLRTREIDSGLNVYREVYQQYDIQSTPEQTIDAAMSNLGEIIGELYAELDAREATIEDLEDRIETEQKDGYATIRGSILAFVAQGQDFNRYQRVCAETVTNPDKQYCVSVSAIQQEYELVVPDGEYFVFAQLQGEGDDSARAYYTEFVTCSQSDSGDDCPADLSQNRIAVNVEPGQELEGIEPIDWQIEGIDITNQNQEVQNEQGSEEQSEQPVE